MCECHTFLVGFGENTNLSSPQSVTLCMGAHPSSLRTLVTTVSALTIVVLAIRDREPRRCLAAMATGEWPLEHCHVATFLVRLLALRIYWSSSCTCNCLQRAKCIPTSGQVARERHDWLRQWLLLNHWTSQELCESTRLFALDAECKHHRASQYIERCSCATTPGPVVPFR